jgi:uracil-DNA glycosylase
MNKVINISTTNPPQLEESWKTLLKEEFESEYYLKLNDFLATEKSLHSIYPPEPMIFNAFNKTAFDKIKVVIIGQDPYHGPGQAHGLCFSVAPGVKPPPSLVNIFKEIRQDLGIDIAKNYGNLEYWAEQGVLLLNSTLTVRANSPGSHQNKGWEFFSDKVIQLISEKRSGIVFLLWGNFARKKSTLIDAGKHFILEAAHPSPFSAHSGFFGCRHFSKTNQILRNLNKSEIDWNISKQH